MATLADIGVSALINIITAVVFLLAFAILRIQPINDRVYFPKWYINGGRNSPRASGSSVRKYVNLNIWTYFTFLKWMPAALKMSEDEIISHAGFDSAVFLRIYTLGFVHLLSHCSCWVHFDFDLILSTFCCLNLFCLGILAVFMFVFNGFCSFFTLCFLFWIYLWCSSSL